MTTGIAQRRLGFFNARLNQRMVQKGISASELAQRAAVSYEHVRKLLIGHCLPSDNTLERLCSALQLNRKEMEGRVKQG
jgi:transcriptional regulator with XRE-family HTH domain